MDAMRMLLLAFLFSTFAHAEQGDFVSVCDRGQDIKVQVEFWFQRNCSRVSREDLLFLTYFHFEGKKTLHLKAGDLADFSNLRKLTMKHMGKVVIDSEAIADLPNLESIYFKQFDELVLKPRALKNVPELKDIVIHTVSLKKLPRQLIDGPANLAEVIISDAKLDEIPDGAFESFNLQRLIVTGNSLRKTSKAAFNGVHRVLGLPVDFGVAESKEEWTP